MSSANSLTAGYDLYIFPYGIFMYKFKTRIISSLVQGLPFSGLGLTISIVKHTFYSAALHNQRQ